MRFFSSPAKALTFNPNMALDQDAIGQWLAQRLAKGVVLGSISGRGDNF